MPCQQQQSFPSARHGIVIGHAASKRLCDDLGGFFSVIAVFVCLYLPDISVLALS
jgi:hypothetical protein